ncbi:type IV secretion system protein [Anaplasma phagocytophilum]|uniref:type IV secretion system protein n=1 Tax=Anaplasma phagocytophilum TaxID=948 RepID=UPI0018B047C3
MGIVLFLSGYDESNYIVPLYYGGLAFLLTLAPIFITFLLFQVTKGLFDGWLKMLVNFMLQPVILFAALAFLNQVIITSLHAVTDFAACESCAVGSIFHLRIPKLHLVNLIYVLFRPFFPWGMRSNYL